MDSPQATNSFDAKKEEAARKKGKQVGKMVFAHSQKQTKQKQTKESQQRRTGEFLLFICIMIEISKRCSYTGSVNSFIQKLENT